MDKLVTGIIFTAYLVAGHLVIADRRPIRSVLATAETITDYETVSPVIIYQSAETLDGYPHDLWIKFDMPGKAFELHLTMNKNLLSPNYAESFFEDGKIIYKKDRKNCFYHGTVVGFTDWTVALSTCAGLRGTFGDHSDVSTLYHIEPLLKTSNEIEQTCIVYGVSQLSVERRNGTCGCNESHRVELPEHNVTMPFDRVRRQSATRIVEWFVYNDRRQYIAQGQDVGQTALHTVEIANTVDLLYAKIGIRVALVGVQTWSQQDLIVIVSDPDIVLDNFHDHIRLQTEQFDSAMLITGIDLDGSTVGLAPVGAMCSRISGGLTQDTGASTAIVSSIAAHEMGHIFNMNHDDGRGCTCSGTNNLCIMAATLARPPPVEWSSCSVSDMNAGFARGIGRCLTNEPTDIFTDPKCGNGIREGEEVCDCGTSDMCDDPCCNPNTCQFKTGAVCSNREPCCSNCQYVTSGTVCRSASNDCDIAEYCTGTSGECPADRTRQSGADCANGQAYCFDGICQDLDARCNLVFAPFNGVTSTAGPQECFNLNTAGEEHGNCGHTTTDYIACANNNVNCGQLQCQDAGTYRYSAGTSVRILTRGIFVDGSILRCKSFTSLPGDDIMPGLVLEGAKCGTNRVCRNRQCIARQLTACPSANSNECSGNGICNDLNQCSCNVGFTGSNCNSRVTGTRVDGGWAQWTSWSTCTVTCGAGSRTRTRTCTDPTPQGGGADCVGSSSSTESCNVVACPDKPNENNGTKSEGEPNSGGGSGGAIGGAVAAVVIVAIIIVVVVIVVLVYRRRKATKFTAVATTSRNEPDFAYRKPYGSDDFVTQSAAVSSRLANPPPRPANPPPRPTNPPPVRSYNPPPVVDQPSQPQRREPPIPPTKTQVHPQVSSPTQAPSRPLAPPKPQAPLKPQAPSKPQALPKPQAPPKPLAPPKPEVAPRPKPKVWPPQSDNTDGRGPPPAAPKKPLRPPPRNY